MTDAQRMAMLWMPAAVKSHYHLFLIRLIIHFCKAAGLLIDFTSEVSHIHLDKLQSKVFSAGLSVLLSCYNAGSHCCKLLLKTTEEDKEESQEVTRILAAARDNCVDAAVLAVLSEPNSIFAFKEQRMVFLLQSRLALATHRVSCLLVHR